jgi:uncharacterized protein
MASAVRKTFVNILGSATTTIAGFLALCVMQITIGADIGLVMSKGVLIGLICTVTVLPSLILALDTPIHKLSHRPLMFTFKWLSSFVSKYAGLFAVVFVLLFIPAIYGRDHTKQDYDLSGGIAQVTPSALAGQKLVDDFNMTTLHFVIVRDDLPPAAIRDMLRQYEKVEGIGGVLAIEKYVGALIPEEFLPESVRSIFKHEGKEIIIITTPYEVSTPQVSAQLEAITAITKNFDPDALITGEGALTKDLITIANTDFKHVDFVSIIAIFIIVVLVFSSLSIPVILVGSIELAIIANLGLPFYLGQSVSFMSSIVIGCIQLGVTIDYTILLVSRFREELQTGLPTKEAMQQAFQKSAPSILVSVLILSSATAGVAFVTQMGMLKSICTLLARGAVISMCVIFFLLPSLLIIFEKIIAKTTLNWRKPSKREQDAQKESSL